MKGHLRFLWTLLLGTLAKSTADLTALTLPTLSVQPTDQFAYVGTEVTFAAKATGTEPIFYQWQFRGIDLPGATNAALTITNVQLLQAGKYSIRAFNVYGSAVSREIELRVSAQLEQLWSANLNCCQFRSFAMDNTGGVYVAGESNIVSFDSNGRLLWQAPAPQYARVVVDQEHVWGVGPWAVCMLDQQGQQIWSTNVVGLANAVPDGLGGLYLSDSKATWKLTEQGRVAWRLPYPGAAMRVDASGFVYVTGSILGDKGYDYSTSKIDKNGRVDWTAQYGGLKTTSDVPSDLAVDREGNVYVTGLSGYAYVTAKYSAHGAELWVAQHGARSIDSAVPPLVSQPKLALDTAGNAFITGTVSPRLGAPGSHGSVVLIKYDRVGSQVWARWTRFSLAMGAPVWVATDLDGNVYRSDVTGVLKYDTNGTQLWRLDRLALGMALDRNDNFFLLEFSSESTRGSKFAQRTLAGFPTMVRLPSSQAFFPGADIRLVASATGSPEPTFQWLFNEWPIPGATNATFILTNVQAASAGDYVIVARNEVGSVTSVPVTLSVAGSLLTETAFRADGAFGFTVVGLPGTRHRIEISTNLLDWMPLARFFNISSAGTAAFRDPSSSQATLRFYRVVKESP